jgi:hypothetical protein
LTFLCDKIVLLKYNGVFQWKVFYYGGKNNEQQGESINWR